VHIRGNLVGYIALFFALSAGAYALPGHNKVRSDDIKNGQVKLGDLASNSVNSPKVVDNSLTGSDVAEASLGQVPSAASAGTATSAQNADTLDNLDSTDFLRANAPAGGDLSGTLGNLQLVDSSVGSQDVQDDSLTGTDINETTLSGLATVDNRSLGTCCTMFGGTLPMNTAFNPGNVSTFVDFGNFAIRTPATANHAGDGFQLCNTGTATREVIVYTGGNAASTAGTRQVLTVVNGACTTVDYNGNLATADGDFDLYDERDDLHLVGVGADPNANSANLDLFGMQF
jgi:hypothetical protein